MTETLSYALVENDHGEMCWLAHCERCGDFDAVLVSESPQSPTSWLHRC